MASLKVPIEVRFTDDEQRKIYELCKSYKDENAKLRELVRKVEHYEQCGCYECPHSSGCGVGTIFDDCTMSHEIEREKRELGIEVDE